ncbi:MAG: tetratricopeptide repeat protein [Chloracidobacterium sp.]|nr:tetratricopeptide repeat protein [Chloracidobacterium sp.]
MLAAIIRAADQEKHATVIELCKRSIRHVGRSWRVWSIYSDALSAIGRPADAHKAMDKAISLIDPSNEFLAWLRCKKGHIHREAGDYRSAIDQYLAAHRENSNEATFLIFAGSMFFRLGQHKRAIRTLEKATKCGEGAIDEAYYNLGVVLLSRSKYVEARDSFRSALRLDPNYAEAKKALADVQAASRIGS